MFAPLPETSPAATSRPASTSSKVSLGLGIAGLVLAVLAVVGALVIGFRFTERLAAEGLDAEALQEMGWSTEQLLAFIDSHPALAEFATTAGPLMFVSLVGFVLAQAGALFGLLLGIVGLSQEKREPTERGRLYSILGIGLSILPLLCCMSAVVMFLGASWRG